MARSQISQSLLIDTDTLNDLTDSFPSIKEDYINKSDIQKALRILGFSLPGFEVRELLKELPDDMDQVPLEMFMMLHASVKSKKDMGRNIQQKKVLRGREDVQETPKRKMSTTTDAKHSVREAEERGFSEWLNKVLSKDPICQSYLPVTKETLYERLSDGVLLCKLINSAVADTVFEKLLNTGSCLSSVFKRGENLSLAVNSAEAIGCCVVNIGPEDIANCTPHLVLGLVWQIIRIGLLGLINLTSHAELAALLREDETLEDLRQLTAEELLLRWVNYHLERAGVDRRINNFRGDIQDSEIYTHLINQIAPSDKRDEMMAPTTVLKNADQMRRAELMLCNADILGARVFIEPVDVVRVAEREQNRDKLNLAFVANLFNNYPALTLDPDMEVREETLEEKTYRNWMNSMGVSPFVKDLYSDLKNGLVLLQLMDILKPGIVNWSKIVRVFDRKRKVFQVVDNCTYVLECAGKMGFSLVNVTAKSIAEATPNITLGLCFQMLRCYTMKLLDSVCPGKKDDKVIVAWANDRTEKAGKTTKISGFRDPKIASCVPILDLIDAIVPGKVDYSLLTGEALQDARLTISQARKAGARIYALPQHLGEVNQKMVMTVYACLMLLDHQVNKSAAASQ